jgi:drug/metabolite transporter (DMT)-like permease
MRPTTCQCVRPFSGPSKSVKGGHMRGSQPLAAAVALLFTAAIWGFAFVAQRQGMDHMGPFLFNGLRFALGCVPLLPFLFLHRRQLPNVAEHAEPHQQRRLAYHGVFLGLILFVAASLQQVGIQYTTVGKAGFITGLYVVLVPLLGLLLGTKVGPRVGVGVAFAAAGLYLLTLGGSATGDSRTAANLGDLLMFVCAIFWALHIIAVGRWSPQIPWAQLAVTQFVTCAIVSLLVAAFIESISLASIQAGAVPLLYAGFISVGLGYSIQVVAQRQAAATPAAIIMSLETLFAVLGGWWLLAESLGPTQLLGCALMLLAMAMASIRPLRDLPQTRQCLPFPSNQLPKEQHDDPN